MVRAINPKGDSLFTQKNYNSSLLEVNNNSLVVLLVEKPNQTKQKKKQFQNMMATYKSGP